jgi:hypothetical protein
MDTGLPPQFVQAASRLSQDLDSLAQLFAPVSPPRGQIWTHSLRMCVFGFVDASGSGFGSSFQLAFQLALGHILFWHGVWGRDADSTSSNFKELRNSVEAFEHGVTTGELTDTELYVFRDNSTAEATNYKGNLASKLLFDLILHL